MSPSELHGETWSWIEGRVGALDGEALRGPVGGGDCVAYEIWGYRVLSGQRIDARACSFVLHRGVERFVVRVAELNLDRDKMTSRGYWTTGRARSAAALAFLSTCGLVGGPSKVMQVVEWTVPVGATVRLWGRTRVLVAPDGQDAGYRAPPRRPVLQARKLEVVDELSG